MNTSLIVTVLNEENSISHLLQSISRQSILPTEVIITDGGSYDRTISKCQEYSQIFRSLNVRFRIIHKIGNRAVGRNEAIRKSTGKFILITDAGCILREDWVEEIMNGFQLGSAMGRSGIVGGSSVDVVAGYYEGKAETVFQKCLIPYVLVMSDKIDPGNFLPASRSMALTRATWLKTGGFPEEYDHNEDFVFANKLHATGAVIKFQQEAIVYWLPVRSLRGAFTMFKRFALGDAQAGILRPKVILLFLRYFIGISLTILFFIIKSNFLLYTLYLILIIYIAWSIQKNYRYVKNPAGFYFLPLLQLTSDGAVIAGTFAGMISRIFHISDSIVR